MNKDSKRKMNSKTLDNKRQKRYDNKDGTQPQLQYQQKQVRPASKQYLIIKPPIPQRSDKLQAHEQNLEGRDVANAKSTRLSISTIKDIWQAQKMLTQKQRTEATR